jgi:lipoprotein signal peptidase
LRIFAASLILVPLIDHAVKWMVLAGVRDGSIPLGFAGRIRVVRTRIWMARASGSFRLSAMWLLWITAAALSALACSRLPALALPCGLLLGGALSHALETTVRGSICDWLCLRCWPAFNLADVALTAGGLTLAVEVVTLIHAAAPR